MMYREFQDKQLSLLGFGTMRLPVGENSIVDEAKTAEMVDYALENGVNYFDTAFPYHDGQSERVIGRVLSSYDRESFYLATKYPGHQITDLSQLEDTYNPKLIFEEQLKRCQVEYFDFYLLHNVYEKSVKIYTDPQWGILDYFKEQKRLGRIKHLGFSTHGSLETMKEFLDYCGEDMEFCQIQLNYLDWTLQSAKEKYDLLTEHNIPVWVMEPVRGGKLAKFDEETEAKLKAFRPEESAAAWGFRFLQALPNVKMVLSGMSNMEQMQDNVKTFSVENPLKEAETDLLLEIAEGMKDSIPCTSCRYCCAGCPQGLDIPMLLNVYNEVRVVPTVNAVMPVEALPAEKKPSACIGCGKCMTACPQGIHIPQMLGELTEAIAKLPTWEAICIQRAAIQKRDMNL